LERGFCLQRLFSTFPNGWPGRGLLLLRLGAGIPLVGFAIVGAVNGTPDSITLAAKLIGGVAGLLLIVGLWTPIAGSAAALVELGIAFSWSSSLASDTANQVLLALLSAAVAMLGPGAWSIDARLFGRKRFDLR